MNLKRFYVNSDMESGDQIKLGKEHYNYLVNVMRMKRNDKAVLFNNTGYDFLCQIENIEKNHIELLILNKTLNETEAKRSLTLYQALVKGEKMDLILQKTCELGLTKVVPFESKFCIAKHNPKKKERQLKVIENATNQCGRSKLMRLGETLTFKQMLEDLKDYDQVFLAYEKGGLDLETNMDFNAQNSAFIIGSEGGFDENEVEQIIKLSNVKLISLGKRILRAETAAITLSSILMHELGELK